VLWAFRTFIVIVTSILQGTTALIIMVGLISNPTRRDF